ncbi:hypothetical protein GCM10028805_44520 [Spirosoma harenae]
MKIIAIELYTADLIGTRSFYTRQLGLPIISESVDSLTLQVGWTLLTFRTVDKPTAPYHFAITVPTDMLEVCMHCYPLNYRSIQGQEIVEMAEWRTRACYFRDNNGNLLKFVTKRELTWFDPNFTMNDLFQGITEMGIASECVPTTTRQLMDRFGLPLFRRFLPTLETSILGNETGLLSIVQTGTNWPFTQTSASMNHCQITFEVEPGGSAQSLYCYGINQWPVSTSKPLFVGTHYIRAMAQSLHSQPSFAN